MVSFLGLNKLIFNFAPLLIKINKLVFQEKLKRNVVLAIWPFQQLSIAVHSQVWTPVIWIVGAEYTFHSAQIWSKVRGKNQNSNVWLFTKFLTKLFSLSFYQVTQF